jgi:ribosome-associated translation inhibitor RaiA
MQQTQSGKWGTIGIMHISKSLRALVNKKLEKLDSSVRRRFKFKINFDKTKKTLAIHLI